MAATYRPWPSVAAIHFTADLRTDMRLRRASDGDLERPELILDYLLVDLISPFVFCQRTGGGRNPLAARFPEQLREFDRG